MFEVKSPSEKFIDITIENIIVDANCYALGQEYTMETLKKAKPVTIVNEDGSKVYSIFGEELLRIYMKEYCYDKEDNNRSRWVLRYDVLYRDAETDLKMKEDFKNLFKKENFYEI